MRQTQRTIGIVLSLAVLALDQASKALARTYLSAEPVEIGPFLSLRLGFNRGVSFGLFAGAGDLGRWLLVAGTAAVALWLLVWMWREARLGVVAPLALITGGALGTIVDRVRTGAVTDFIDAHVGDAHWPTFNLADSAITIGVAWLVLTSLGPRPPRGGQRGPAQGERACPDMSAPDRDPPNASDAEVAAPVARARAVDGPQTAAP